MNEAAYPIFFPTYTPVPTGYARDWWWYDPGVCAEDTGPFATRSEAVADWALHHFSQQLIQEVHSLDLALGSPLLVVPATPVQTIPVINSLRRTLSEQQNLLDAGLDLVAQFDTAQQLDAAYLLQEVSA